ncbi:hypothetical protein [Massilia sp. erpn]|uniref:hypothetical protein n=1 Tax=Massilia sp. erpn TaxID=2738142 RepID=UPI0021031E55|nr:hypothetical protein [Massilia sp. erpn]UTY59695.1 hypothetical protein HPQ68_22460 [Massilia sp. erpn]
MKKLLTMRALLSHTAGDLGGFRRSGGTQGFRNMRFAYTESGQGAVVMTNSDNGAQLIDEVLRAIAREYGGRNYLVANAPAVK